ncbi:MAG: MFS transporter [Candidatus Cloacimonadales bacterium]
MSKRTHHITRAEDRISLKQKSAYSVGMLVNNLQAAALPAMVVILNIGMGMNAFMVGLLVSLPRIFDAVSDPLVGYISDNARTRWGRRRPFIFVGAIIAGLIFALMWQLPPGYIDILGKQPVQSHQIQTTELQTAEINEAGGIDFRYETEMIAQPQVIFYGPKTLSQNQGENLLTNIDGFPQVELNIDISKSQPFRIILQEANLTGNDLTADGETYYIDLKATDSQDGKGKLYKFEISDLVKSSILGNQNGNNQLDLEAVKNLSLQLTDVQNAGAVTIQSFKLRKEEIFFTKYFIYFLIMSILFFLAYTIYATPFVAFGYEMTPDYHERTRLHAFANTIGQFAWLGVPWFYAIMSSNLFEDTVHGARVLAVAVGIIVALLGIVPAIFLREKQVLTPIKTATVGLADKMKEFFGGVVTTFKCKPFVKICAATFLVFNGFQLGMSFSIYVMIYYLFNGSDAAAGKLMGWFGMLTSIATLAVIQITGWMAIRIGKRRTFMITISLSIVGFAVKWFGYNPDQPYMLLLAAPLVAFGTGSLFTLMGSMISDVCDYDELQTHQRREGVFGAIYWWMVKIGMALAGLLTGVLLTVANFDLALGAGQEEQTLFLIRIFDVGIPLITSLIALLIMAKYSITEEKAYEIRNKLELRHAKIKETATAAELKSKEESGD